MIPVLRGAEPAALPVIRQQELDRLRQVAATRAITSADIRGYELAAESLWRGQHHKCCYCEQKIRKLYNDVEHYRPKARSDRRPGCTETHGYWWLAFSWENLLFACPPCNRSGKNDRFPLSLEDVALQPEEQPPGQERPLLLDPARSNPVEHIVFQYCSELAGGPRQWLAMPRDGSPAGSMTIEICDLNHPEQRELRGDHVEQQVAPQVRALEQAILAGDEPHIRREHARALGLLQPENAYVALTYDALCLFVPAEKLGPWQLGWPSPGEVGLAVGLVP